MNNEKKTKTNNQIFNENMLIMYESSREKWQ